EPTGNDGAERGVGDDSEMPPQARALALVNTVERDLRSSGERVHRDGDLVAPAARAGSDAGDAGRRRATPKLVPRRENSVENRQVRTSLREMHEARSGGGLEGSAHEDACEVLAKFRRRVEVGRR